MHVRLCVDCGEEYRPEILVCADCGGALEDRFEEPKAAADTPPGPPPVSGPRRTVHSATDAAEIEPLARLLGQAGIPFAVRGAINAFDLIVQEADLDRAISVLRALLPPHDAEDAFDPERGYARCPACQADLAPGTPACPDCGLVVVSEPDGEDR
jgi:predicted amidophosphoribosyltransferase